MKKRINWNDTTRLNHPEEVKMPEGNRPLLQPIYHSAKFTPGDNISYWDQFIYGRISNPTNQQLELTLAELQKKEDCLVLSSGIAAVSTMFLSLLKMGDHMISFRELYKPGRVFIKEILPRYGISSSLLRLRDINLLEDSIIEGKTKLIHFESPTNPHLEMADIEKIISIARKHKLLVTMDGTFAGLHQHNQFDIDVMLHSLTKFGNGHGDVIAGSLAGKKSIMKEIRELGLFLGAHLDPQAVYLIERGLKTYFLRYQRQTETAIRLALFLESHPKVKWVNYPGLTSFPGKVLFEKQMKDSGAVIAFEIDTTVSTSADKFCHKLELIQLAASLGSTETIICPTQTFFGQDLNENDKKEMKINSFSLRMSVGLEEADDLINDLNQALG